MDKREFLINLVGRDNVSPAADKAGRSVEKFNRKLEAVGDFSGKLGLGLTALFAGAVTAAAKFDKQMSSVSAATNASSSELDKLRKAALQAGKDTSFSATEAAQGIEELSKAGVSTSAILSGGLKGALDLAAAGQIKVGQAAEIAASAMTQFKLSGKDVPHVADLLAAGAGKAQGSVEDLSRALGQGGLVAAQMGLSVEDTTGTLAAFASAGLLGSDAGTSLKTMFLALANPSSAAAKTMKQLGISAYDAGGNFVGVTKLAGILQTRLAGLTQEQRNAALATIFGSDAIRAASILYDQGAQGIQGWIDKTNDAGYAAETAKKKTDNLAGDIERLTGSLETLAIQAGSGTNTGLRTLVKAADSAITSFSNLPGPVQSTLTVITGISGVSLLAVAGLIKLKTTTDNAMQALRGLGPAGETAAAGIGKTARVIGKASAIGTVLFLAYEGAKAFSDWASRNAKPTQVNVEGMAKSLQELAKSGKATGELAKVFGPDMQGIAKSMRVLATAQEDMKKATEDFVPVAGRGMTVVNRQAESLKNQSEDAKAAIAGLDEGLAKLAGEGGATQAKIAFEQLSTQFGITASQLPKYSEAANNASSANTGLAKGFGDTAANARTMNTSLADAISKGQTLLDVWKQLNGATLSVDESMLEAKNAVDDVKKAFEENGNAIAGDSQKALENRIAVGKAAEAAANAAQKKYEETGSVAEARKVYDTYIEALKRTLHNAHLTDAQIQVLINTYARLPDSINTKVTANTTQAQAAINAVQQSLGKIRDVHVGVYYTVKGDLKLPGGTSLKNRWGGVYEKAAVGTLREASTYSATNPGRYMIAEPSTGGEAFIPKYGNRKRSLGILQKAASWYGVGMGGSGGGIVINGDIVLNGVQNVDDMIRGIRKFVRIAGNGNVQAAFGG